VSGTISVDGSPGQGNLGSGISQGGQGGPGGFRGGNGGGLGNNPAPTGGQGIGGGSVPSQAGFYNSFFFSLLPLFGGSGGAGGAGQQFNTGGAGGGGGGAIAIASSTKITVNGSVTVKGGDGGGFSQCFSGGAGSGGAIRLVAAQITGSGSIRSDGGFAVCGNLGTTGPIRLEAFNHGFSGIAVPTPALSLSPGPVTAASNPALINLPTLKMSSVGSVALPAVPAGSYAAGDVVLPPGTTNPVSVILSMTNLPVGTVFSVKVLPPSGNPTTASTGASTGTFSSSTATASVTLPTGQISVLNAFGSFTLTGLMASLFPLIDGEEVDRIMVVAAYGVPSSVTLVTKSGKAVRLDQLALEAQVRLAQAFDALAKE
ncbi:MAG: hypothetical protein ACREI2_13775, partial [Nitrospiraceae bacterium]